MPLPLATMPIGIVVSCFKTHLLMILFAQYLEQNASISPNLSTSIVLLVPNVHLYLR